MNPGENKKRAATFRNPEWIPVSFHINYSCWHHYDQKELKMLMADHKKLFPDYEYTDEEVKPNYAPWQKAGKPYTDPWGCVWETADDGITGAVVDHPIKTWDDFKGYKAPDPDKVRGWGNAVDWEQEKKNMQNRDLKAGGLRHGHTFLTLTYIRGYENLLFDMMDERPELRELIQMVEDYNMAIVKHYLDCGIEWMGYAEDLGMQVGPMITPAMFEEFIKPSYTRIIAPAREAGCIIHQHSDGDIRQLVGHLIEGGVEVINLQDLVNGIDWIEENLKGTIAIDLDIDRQAITRFGTPEEIDSHIKNCVEKLNTPEGGLMMVHGMYPGIPIENANALMDAFEKYCF